jgi:tetratricopeptide (TPR) repeat protein
MIHSAKKAYENGNIILALELYHQVFNDESHNIDALEGLARSCNRLKRYEEATRYCHLALEIDSTLVWPHIVLSYVNFYQGQIETSRNEAMQAIQMNSDEWEPNYLWGNLLNQENKVDDALLFLEKARFINPDNWYVYNSLSVVYLRMRNLEKHYESLKHMNRLKPNLLLSFRIHVGRHSRAYSIGLILIHYILLALSIIQSSPAFLLFPGFMNVAWIIIGIFSLFNPKYIGRREGRILAMIGVIQGLMIFLVFKSLR